MIPEIGKIIRKDDQQAARARSRAGDESQLQRSRWRPAKNTFKVTTPGWGMQNHPSSPDL
jgi:hypothetical protein